MNKKVLLLLVLVIFIHIIFNQSLQLHYDEAYYWVWSKNLQLSYFDHPPMIAYLIHLTTLISDKEFFIRLSGVICGIVTILSMYFTARRLFNQKVADITIILALAWPILEGTFFITTIDSPLFMFWSLTLYCLTRGIFFNQRAFIYLAGAFLGLDLLSKYTAILILPSVLIYLLLSPTKRRYLLNLDIYLALSLAILIFSPVLIWNYQHNWVSFAFQIHHGIAKVRVINFTGLADYLGSMLGAANPFISIPLFGFLIVKRKQLITNEKYLFLASFFIFVTGFFAYNSLYKFMEANWVAPAFISGIILLAAYLVEYDLKWVWRSAIGVIIVLLPLVKMPDIFVPRSLQSKIPAINAFMGQKQLYQQIKKNYLHSNDIILSCDYGNASRGWYYLNQDRTYVLSNFKYSFSYRYWNSNLALPIKNALYFCDSDDTIYQQQLKVYFKHIEKLPIIKYHNSFVENKLYLYRLSN